MADEQKPTKPEVSAPTDREVMDKILVKVGGLESTLGKVDDRLIVIEEWKESTDNRLATASLRVKSTSDNDLRQDGAIAKIVTDVALLKAGQEAAEKRDNAAALVLDNVFGKLQTASTSFFSRHPAVGTALVGLFTAAISAATIYFQTYGRH